MPVRLKLIEGVREAVRLRVGVLVRLKLIEGVREGVRVRVGVGVRVRVRVGVRVRVAEVCSRRPKKSGISNS